ncbi:TonB-dependent receptor [Chitinophaga silvatica]|uniref:TonB-dependent receptor n=1 Tax=Chitinophaga silvatica TaxID=2282649 RepID=A0A3E1YGM8_9BACT|nr:TonB-dependent receptor [Chitinophaga silvatica]RFS26573.1 TonB-dependent receptor [Chitinophaga silvatica]
MIKKYAYAFISFGLLTCSLQAAQAQFQTSLYEANEQQTIFLVDALKRITQEWNTRFVYESSLVREVKVTYNWRDLRKSNAENVLQAILTPKGLVPVNIGDNYFSIIKLERNNSPQHSTVSNVSLLIPADTIPIAPAAIKSSSGAITGRVTEKSSGRPVIAASVSVPELGLFTVTDTTGTFYFKEIPLGKVRVTIQSLNTVPSETTVIVNTPQVYKLSLELDKQALALKEVQVVASESRAGSATASHISQTAIEHLQATSLADVMQLLPGALAKNPDMSKVNRFAIRQISPDNMGSLGTAVILNGAPLSNNANLQSLNTAKSGALAGFETSSGGGTDLRQVSADNIESIEVIRGVPSVEYGDLTSGAILVKTKAGPTPYHLKARINPTLTQMWLGKGFALGEKYGSLNLDVDYTKSYSDQRYDYNAFNRVTINALHSKKFFKNQPLFATTGFTFATNLDNQKQDPDDYAQKIVRRSKDMAFRFNTSGKWSLQRKFARMLNYTLSLNYSVQDGFYQKQIGGGITPLINSMKDTTMYSSYLQSEYLSKYWINGRPMNAFAKVTNSFFGKTGVFKHRVLMGAEWKMDANFGDGKTFDLNLPPAIGSDGSVTRPRPFKDIPALQQLSAYAEDRITANFLQRQLTIQAGLRYDQVSKTGGVLSPRVNLAYPLMPKLYLRAGVGITAKSPSLLYLYPENAYFDYINLNSYSDDPSKRVMIATTKVYQPANEQLKMAVNNKKEIGFDWQFADNKRLTITAYHEKLKNGYSFLTTFNSINVMPLQLYKVVNNGGQQSVETGAVINRMPAYDMPVNDALNTNKGVEFDLDLGRFEALRTSFVFNGAYMNSQSISTNYYILKGNPYRAGEVEPDRVGVYAPGRGKEDEQFSTTLRMIHHIPQLRFVITLSAQTLWVSKNKYLNYDSLAVGYISRTDGSINWLSEDERMLLSRKNLADREIILPISPANYITESWKPLWLFNMRLTKEIGKNIGFSFYANNVFMSNPLERSTRNPTTYDRRNQRLFFGTEINVKF